MNDPHRARPERPDEMAHLHQLFQEVILDHYRRPRNKGPVEDPTHKVTMNNPFCGDVIDLLLRVKGDRIVEARFEGRGCSISLASASMMTGKLKGKLVADALRLAETFTRMLHGDADASEDPELGDLRALQGVSRFPVRVKCALLPWNCLEELVG
jgi:nitrogen fixation NifU-like protein